ncbi:GspE/PulE family protein [Acetivibrio straminisolvens]|jgi:type IV pilus assembly protein PilB|uniref:GspE/PulE family protein n=1 Tax=Acetivibrio straminisolvens TaxID=253314 RepID=UPI002240C075|nr:type II/IV secretion system protein [Acetivibrio straminisolvens]
MYKQRRKRLGDLLMEAGLISKEQLDKALELQKTTGKKLGVLLASEGIVAQEDIVRVLEGMMGISHVALEEYNIDPAICNLIPEKLARRYELIPIDQKDGVLTVAMSDPLNVFAIDDVEVYTGMEVLPVIAFSPSIKNAIEKYFKTQHILVEPVKEKGILFKIDEETIELESIEADDEPASMLVNSIIEQAIRSQASDIHIEPFQNVLKIRFRTDGQMHEVMRTGVDMLKGVASRVKAICGMNINEKAAPQDGRVVVSADERDYYLKVSILPTVFGEKIAIHIVDKKTSVIPKDRLGMTKEDLVKFDKIIRSPQGMVLVTGPAGSGKTTTLYTAINEINSPNIHIITIEDPVEYVIEGVNHVQVNSKTGLTYEKGLVSILEQGPDVIMIGDIKDAKIAEIAVKAAIEGQLVLGAFHANDALDAIIRLVEMGIEPFFIASSLVGVISQRLVRRICPKCRKKRAATGEELSLLELDAPVKLYSGRGCEECSGTGYKGRLGVFEVMDVGKSLKELIKESRTKEELKKLAVLKGMKTLKENLKQLVLEGKTTASEMSRILFFTEEL